MPRGIPFLKFCSEAVMILLRKLCAKNGWFTAPMWPDLQDLKSDAKSRARNATQSTNDLGTAKLQGIIPVTQHDPHSSHQQGPALALYFSPAGVRNSPHPRTGVPRFRTFSLSCKLSASGDHNCAYKLLSAMSSIYSPVARFLIVGVNLACPL
jgi:hypothetical protein